MIANLFHHELLLIDVDLIVLVAEATEYNEAREPSIVPNQAIWKKVLAFLDHLQFSHLNALLTFIDTFCVAFSHNGNDEVHKDDISNYDDNEPYDPD